MTIGYVDSNVLFNIKMSTTSKFLLLSAHFCRFVKFTEILFFICTKTPLFCTHLHLLLEYRSGFVKTPAGDMTMFLLLSTFIVNRLLGSGIWLLISPKVSTVSGLELIIDSTSTIKVLSALLFNDWPCVFSHPSKIRLAIWIWCSHTSPIYVMPWVGSGATKSN